MVTVVQPRAITVEQFIARYRDDNRYELIDGAVSDLEPTGPHEKVATFIDCKLNVQIDTLGLPYFILQRGMLQLLGNFTAFRPDVVVVDNQNLAHEPLWARECILTLGQSVKLVAEVVSSNWQNDYARKLEDYAILGIPEYWIVDYAGLGGEVFIGRPKQPTLTLCTLCEDRRYQTICLRGDQPINSPTFPNLQITAEQVLVAG